MHAIIFADRHYHGLTTLVPDSCPALLPVVGKAVIEYTLEELADAGIAEATVFVGPHAAELRALLGHGERWGLRLSIAHSRGAEYPVSLMDRLGRAAPCSGLAVRGDELRSHTVRAFLESVAQHPNDAVAVAGTDAHGTVGMVFGTVNDPAFGGLMRGTPATQPAAAIALPSLQILPLDTPAAVLAANRAIADGSLNGPLRAGIEHGRGLRRGYQAVISAAPSGNGHAYVGDRCEVHPRASLRGCVVVGADSYVDRDTVLENCVVLPGTYVGAGLHIRNAIVSPRGLVHAVSGQHLDIHDPLWLSPMSQQAETVPVNERLFAMLLAVATLPLWPLAFGRKSLTGLIDVGRGRMRLFGAPPSDAPTQSEWARVATPPPIGLISLARLTLHADAPTEERWLAESVYAHASLGTKLIAAARGLFTRRWRKPASAVIAGVQ